LCSSMFSNTIGNARYVAIRSSCIYPTAFRDRRKIDDEDRRHVLSRDAAAKCRAAVSLSREDGGLMKGASLKERMDQHPVILIYDS
jgi:hypothetical protein